MVYYEYIMENPIETSRKLRGQVVLRFTSLCQEILVSQTVNSSAAWKMRYVVSFISTAIYTLSILYFFTVSMIALRTSTILSHTF